jgi:hypothetical protein
MLSSMARFALLLLLLFFFGSCAYYSGGRSRFGSNDYAVLLGTPYPAEVRLAHKRLHNFLDRADRKDREVLGQTPYVAVQAYALTAGEIPWFTRKLILDRVRAVSAFSTDSQERENAQVKFLLIFNHQTGELATPEGMFVIDTPQRGAIGQIGGFRAIYAGTGWW